MNRLLRLDVDPTMVFFAIKQAIKILDESHDPEYLNIALD